jgi:hypothetical protein
VILTSSSGSVRLPVRTKLSSHCLKDTKPVLSAPGPDELTIRMLLTLGNVYGRVYAAICFAIVGAHRGVVYGFPGEPEPYSLVSGPRYFAGCRTFACS